MDEPGGASKPKRRLPLLAKVEVADESDVDRPPWHWSAIGAVAIFLAWLPLAYLTNAMVRSMLAATVDPDAAPAGMRAAIVTVNAAAFALAAFGGGFLVGRFGGTAGRKETTVSGFAAASIAWALAAVQGARTGLLVWALLLAAMIAIGAAASRVGGALGLRGRRP